MMSSAVALQTFPQGSYNVLVMDLLGYSLEDLFNRCGRRFTLVCRGPYAIRLVFR